MVSSTISGLTPQLRQKLRVALLECGPFDSAASLQALFSDTRIAAWRYRLPEASTSAGRVEATVDFLYRRENDHGENALALFLQVLGEGIAEGDSCHRRLLALAADVANERSQPQPRPTVQDEDGNRTSRAEIPIELQELVAAGDVGLFVGYGLSQAAGLPGRQALATALSGRLGEALPDPGSGALADVAQLYEVARGRHALLSFLRDQLDTTGVEPGNAHHALARLPVRTIFSTSYDDLLERALRQAGRRVNKVTVDATLPHASADRVQLVKLKGDVEMPDSVVITRGDLDTYALKRPLTLNQLRDRLSATTFLIVGVDANDPDLRFFFEQSGYQAAAGRLHYALLPGLTSLQQQMLRQRHIQTLDVAPESVPGWLEALADSATSL
jgi:hypothetical protein